MLAAGWDWRVGSRSAAPTPRCCCACGPCAGLWPSAWLAAHSMHTAKPRTHCTSHHTAPRLSSEASSISGPDPKRKLGWRWQPQEEAACLCFQVRRQAASRAHREGLEAACLCFQVRRQAASRAHQRPTPFHTRPRSRSQGLQRTALSWASPRLREPRPSAAAEKPKAWAEVLQGCCSGG
jgi:hypothetical protein